MPDLLASDGAERLPLVDADLLLWRRPDLGCDYASLMRQLIEKTEWRQEKVTVYGKSYPQPRLSAWYGDLSYRYSGLQLEPVPWTALLSRLRQRIEKLTGHTFNSVLLNYYRDQHDCMGMHSDDERELGPRPAIASLSLGESRDFVLRHRSRKDQPSVRLPLESGSLLLMQGTTQQHWRHGINRLKRPCGPRLNLTFRRVLPLPPARAGFD